MKLKEILDKTIAFFKDKKIDSPRLDAELLLAHGLGIERIQLYLKFDQPMGEVELQKCRELVRRRSLGEPVAYIVGYKDFYNNRFEVNSHVLIPRPETEHVVEEAIAWIEKNKPDANVVDLGCGSGCIGISIVANAENTKLTSIDISEEALLIAKVNAEKNAVIERVEFISSDASNAADKVPRPIDVLVANPPYIANDDIHVEEGVKKFEPHLALFAEDNGLALLKKWTQTYVNHLAENSIVLMEMGYDQGPAMKAFYESLGVFDQVKIIKDLSGHDRVICGIKNRGA